MRFIFSLGLGLISLNCLAQGYWQQRANYEMNVDFNHEKDQYSGTQKLTYYNNSSDTLDKVFYHLYFNAFQPGSMMDVRSLTIKDPDPRVGARIKALQKDEIGFLHVTSLKHNGESINIKEEETILCASLRTPILPGDSAVFEMVFNGQVPLQVRRSGRDSKEGIDYSMSQWYPKMCEYDHDGWHSNPYIAREFHGIWGDFDVTINMNKAYTLGGTGVLQNPEIVGHGYESSPAQLSKEETLAWHFKAENVHDFVWAADDNYKVVKKQAGNGGPLMYFLYVESDKTETWKELPDYMDKAFQFINKKFGKYPYSQYSFIQGGDGGMEYPMATLITGHRNRKSLVGVSVHELMHSWFQGMMATNESLYAWMDEGFTSYATGIVQSYLLPEAKLTPFVDALGSYTRLAQSGYEEPLTTHSDHYSTNWAYGVGAYSKGALFVYQLSYIIGQENFDKGMLRYYNEWKFKHPTPRDFKRVMEKVSGMELDWYFEQWVGTTKKIDYAITGMTKAGDHTTIQISKFGDMVMPIDIMIISKDNKRELYTIPLQIMRGEKKKDHFGELTVMPDWQWVQPHYQLNIPVAPEKIKTIYIDPTYRMCDVDLENNTLDVGDKVVDWNTSELLLTFSEKFYYMDGTEKVYIQKSDLENKKMKKKLKGKEISKEDAQEYITKQK